MTAPPAAATPRGALDWRRRVAVWCGIGVLRVLMGTWRLERQQAGFHDGERAAGRPVIYAFWHGRMLAGLAAHRGSGAQVLVSEHRDGELIARVLHANGFRTVRGSTSRGGARALLSLVACLARGEAVAFTPDGPRGPRHEAAAGFIAAAARSGVPILPVASAFRRGWRLRSWDVFEIPRPFTRVVVRYGEPVRVPADGARDPGPWVHAFERSLGAAQAAAEAAVA
jgi:lysophospholipid acyltransferase (LPLAT)-like uncharacterized protein